MGSRRLNQQERASALAHMIRFLAEATQAAPHPDALPTTTDLIKALQIDRDHVKKLTGLLREWQLVHSVGMNPKRYRLDSYRLDELLATNLSTEDPLLAEALADLPGRWAETAY